MFLFLLKRFSSIDFKIGSGYQRNRSNLINNQFHDEGKGSTPPLFPDFQNHAFFKITRFSKSRVFQNHAFFKITRFSKSRVFQNHAFFKITHFSKSRVFQNHAFFKITHFSKSRDFENI